MSLNQILCIFSSCGVYNKTVLYVTASNTRECSLVHVRESLEPSYRICKLTTQSTCHILSLLHMSAIFVTHIYLLLAVSLQEFGISLLLYFQSIFTLCNLVRESHEMTTTRKLFVTADDFGYCPNRNKGIIDCFLNGGITDTSLMVNANYTKQAAGLGLKHKLPIGELTLCIIFLWMDMKAIFCFVYCGKNLLSGILSKMLL